MTSQEGLASGQGGLSKGVPVYIVVVDGRPMVGLEGQYDTTEWPEQSCKSSLPKCEIGSDFLENYICLIYLDHIYRST